MPVDTYIRWSRGDGVLEDREKLIEALRLIVADTFMQEALFIASADLHAALAAWIGGETKPDAQLVKAALKYVIRACSRPTPFGMFAATSVVDVVRTRNSSICVGNKSECWRWAQADIQLLQRAADVARSDLERTGVLRYRKNQTLWFRDLIYRWQHEDSVLHDFVSASCPATRELSGLLEYLQMPRTTPELTRYLCSVHGTLPEEAALFVHELRYSGMLEPEHSPPVTGTQALDEFARELGEAGAGEVSTKLFALKVALDDVRVPGHGVAPLRRATELGRSIADIKNPKWVMQVDTFRPATGHVSVEVESAALDALEVLSAFSSSYVDPLAEFKRAFRDRYEHRQVSLLEALDEQVGIGFGAVSGSSRYALPGLALRRATSGQQVSSNARDRVLLSRLTEALRTRQQEIILDKNDAKALQAGATRASNVPFSLFGALISRDVEGIRDEDWSLYVHTLNLPGALNIISRFMNGSPELHVRACSFLQQEPTGDMLIAEIVHIPRVQRAGNIVRRPVLSEYEIPIFARSGVATDKQIGLDDLRLRLRGDRLILSSARLGKDIATRLTTAHNFAMPTNLPLYRFMSLLHHQGRLESLGWSWGACWAASYLPRVRYGRCIVSWSRWNIRRADLLPVLATRSARGLANFREETSLPRFVNLHENDDGLLIDLENPLCAELVLDHMKANPHREVVHFSEAWQISGGATIVANDGKYVHEVIIPFAPRAAQVHSEAAQWPALQTERPLPPRREWRYLKLYGGPDSMDALVLSLGKLLQDAVANGVLREWFFVRYGDPEWHLRLRFRLEGAPNSLDVRRLLAALKRTYRGCWRVQEENYRREFNRYGGAAAMALAERWFCLDSAYAVSMLSVCADDHRLRFLVMLRSVGQMLEVAFSDLDSRIGSSVKLRDGYGRATIATNAIAIGDHFRRSSEEFRSAILPDAANVPARLLEITTKRRQTFAKIWQRLLSLSLGNNMTVPVDDWCESVVHMSMNRLARDDHALIEPVVYDYLARLYRQQRFVGHHNKGG